LKKEPLREEETLPESIPAFQELKQKLIKVILNLSAKMDSMLIAEEIETVEELNALREIGVAIGQDSSLQNRVPRSPCFCSFSEKPSESSGHARQRKPCSYVSRHDPFLSRMVRSSVHSGICSGVKTLLDSG